MADKNMNTKINVDFEESTSRQSLNSGDSLPTLFGKVKKFFSDLKTVAFSGSYNDLSDIPETAHIAYGTCSTSGSTSEKIITISDSVKWELKTGSIITVKFTSTNTASNPTFNVNNTGAKPVWYNTSVITSSNLGYAGTKNRPLNYVYDGTQYVFIGWSYDKDTNTTYSVVTSTNNGLMSPEMLAKLDSIQISNPPNNVSLGIGYCECTTAASTKEKVAELSGYVLTIGSVVSVRFTYAVPASSTLNINDTGAFSIRHKSGAITANVITAGTTAIFMYDGTYYRLISYESGTYSLSAASGSFTCSTSSTSVTVGFQPKAVIIKIGKGTSVVGDDNVTDIAFIASTSGTNILTSTGFSYTGSGSYKCTYLAIK